MQILLSVLNISQHYITDRSVALNLTFSVYLLRNKSWMPECVLSFNMDWH